MELYSELLIARFSILDMCPGNRAPDPAVAEGVAAIVLAAPRTELKGTSQLAASCLEPCFSPVSRRCAELHILREVIQPSLT